MCSEDESFRLALLPVVSIPDRSELAILVDILDVIPILLVIKFLPRIATFRVRLRNERDFIVIGWSRFVAYGRIRYEECVLLVAGGMLLGHEESVEVPETGLDEVVSRHFRETHFKEDLAEFMADFHY